MKLTLTNIQNFYAFKQPLSLYTMGLSGKPEEREQKAFIACLMAEFPRELGHNEGLDIYSRLIVATSDFYDSGKFKGARMLRYKKMGYQSGTPDITILYPSRNFHGFVVEMKSLTGRPTAQQKTTLQTLKDSGYYAVCAKGFAHALYYWLQYFLEEIS